MLSMKYFVKKIHRNYVLNVLTFEIVCVQYKRGNSSLYLIFLLICQFIIECSDVEDFFAAVDFGLLRYLIRFLWLLIVERLLIFSLSWNVSWNYYSFFVNSFNLTFYYCPLVTVSCFQSKSFVWISIAWNFSKCDLL